VTGTASTPSAYQGSLSASKPVQNARSRGQAELKSLKPMVLRTEVRLTSAPSARAKKAGL